jgi:hypothetical protein
MNTPTTSTARFIDNGSKILVTNSKREAARLLALSLISDASMTVTGGISTNVLHENPDTEDRHNGYVFLIIPKDAQAPASVSPFKKSYGHRVSEMLHDLHQAIRPLLNTKFQSEINYYECTVEILNDDAATVWVKWGKYDCSFDNLPVRAMATVTDNIVRSFDDAELA